ncbi:GAP1-N2 domain-containing protein [Humisphaera borealis]|uniref:Uncharacterized protein n=1 Tax=Humisphaera borealis TaxID=2807512 RepID=A0A7M2WR94_9BACT|nr:hypothetical protein [Humisphaera borealis]QOV87996.1 hypothetical protein IPV69_17200 [Humisphaera borealis]
MSHEIYYTSAPEGLRPGQRGFCTVATTDGIPRPLWDRLESVSGYRHEFTTGSGGRNPVTWAHWLLQVQGREISTLSRICDSGLDYTQRTNSFAHHIAIEATERAAGGPAWMIARPGTMQSRWDGMVGSIHRRSPLPIGDVRPAPCSAWQRLTGDAGWGGVLAEAGLKSPRKPVCILFGPDHDVLPLIAEAIALLPASKRWDITFSTYFTGLPGNAICAWRCCLAGTPAAADAVRHAGGGLVIDLTRSGGLGAPPAGPWVDAARSGRSPVVSGPSEKPRPVPSRAKPATPVEVEVEPLELMPEAFDTPAARPLSSVFDQIEAQSVRGTTTGTARSVDTSWVDHQKSSRMWLLIGVSFVALIFIAAGVWLRMSARQATAERPSTPTSHEDTDSTALPVTPDPVTQPVIKIAPPVPPTPTAPTTAETVVVEPIPVTPVPVKPVVPPTPIQLPTEVQPPATTGAALKAPAQAFSIPAAQFDNLPAIAAFRIAFPGGGSSYTYRQKDLAGVLTADASGGFRYQLVWRDDANKSVPLDVATISLETSQAGGTLEIAWRMKALLNRPEVISLVRVLLHNTELTIADAANRRPQAIRFKQPTPIDVNLTASTTPLTLSTLPDAICQPDSDLPDQWTFAWAAGPATRAAVAGETDVGVLLFERPNSLGGETAKFAVRVGPRWGALRSDFAIQTAGARKAVSVAEAALAKADHEIARLKEAQKAAIDPMQARLAEAVAQLKLTDTELANRFTNRPALRERIKGEKARIEEARNLWDAEVAAATDKREPAEMARRAAAETFRAFEQFQDVQIIVELPGRLRVATLRLSSH